MKKLLIFIIFLFVNQQSFSQERLFIPQEYLSAVNKQTRTLNGYPGSKYWQNKSSYKISAFINTKDKSLSGKEIVLYKNNSPDSLKLIVFRLYQDFNIPTKSRDWETGRNDFSDGVLINSLKINGTEIDLNNQKISTRTGTNLFIKLNPLIFPDSETQIEVVWSFKIPGENFPRMGCYDSTSFMIAYWYPQISVYDDIDGWDKIDYNGMVEFYNDFNDYDVILNTDKENICVWATGVLSEPEKIFNSEYLKRYNLNDSKIITEEDIVMNSRILINGKETKWIYKADNVTDFAFSLSDHFLWDKKIVNVTNGKNVILNSVYRRDSYWSKYVIDISKEILNYFSNDLPGISFPFPSMTVFNGRGGMEYPMMVNDGVTDSWNSTVYLTSHEISHSYFPFYMGTNERKYAWMDEGWAVFLPVLFQNDMAVKNPDVKKDENSEQDIRARNVKAYLRMAGTFYDAPLLVPSNVLKTPSYRHNSYAKAAVVYDILRDMLGDDLFKKALKEYMNRWNGKHPTPYDFFFTFNDASGKNMNWFWQKWFMDYASPDLALKNFKKENNELIITVTNIGELPLPVYLTIKTVEGDTQIIHKSAEIWKYGFSEIAITLPITKEILSIELGSQYVPDLNPENNKLK